MIQHDTARGTDEPGQWVVSSLIFYQMDKTWKEYRAQMALGQQGILSIRFYQMDTLRAQLGTG